MICGICNTSFDSVVLYQENKALFDSIENGGKNVLTDEEESIYLEKYCPGCSRNLLTK